MAVWLLTAATLALGASINPPLGPYTHPSADELAKAVHFGTNDPVVITSYFYWYDSLSGAHLKNADGSDALTDHPPTLTGFSYKSTEWHRQQLLDMKEAGIDVLLPVYWGEPSQRVPGKSAVDQPWSFAGLPPLVQARQALLEAGAKPPGIGLFYDTSTLQHNAAGKRVNLTTEEGRRWFYESIRDFFTLIPARHWATIEGRPIVFLYSSSFAAAHDQTCIDYVRQEFGRDFSGLDPYIVREISWNVWADNTYAWGGALSLRNPGVGALGPGYDHSAVPGRTPLIVPRENGAFFERNWIRFLRAPSKLVHIETWNEYHEATDIAASKEYGRQYIELNRKFVDLFKKGIKPPRPRGPYSDFKSVSVTLQATNDARGLIQIESGDGLTTPAQAGGVACRAVARTIFPGRYVYFQIHDSFKWADRMLVDVEVEYFDQGSGSFRIEYDGPDPNAPFNGAYTASRTSVTLGNTGRWKTAQFRLTEARFLNSQNAGADFRVAVSAATLSLRRVTVTRLGVPAEAGRGLRGWQADFSRPLAQDWRVIPETSKGFALEAGVLRITGSGAAKPAALLPRTIPVLGNQDILARVRFTRECVSQSTSGLVLGTAGESSDGLTVLLACPALGSGKAWVEITLSGGVLGPRAEFPVLAEQWYWLRVRHQTNDIPRYPDVLIRAWPADGETPEPDDWLTWWDYFPANLARHGASGFLALSGETMGGLECDFFLVTADELPETTVRLPALQPAAPRLVAEALDATEGFRFRCNPSADGNWVIETTEDLTTWTEANLAHEIGADDAWRDEAAVRFPRRFYRARAMP